MSTGGRPLSQVFVKAGVLWNVDENTGQWHRRPKPGWWIMRNGQAMPIGAMNDFHLKATIAMIERGKNRTHMHSLRRLYFERSIRRLKRGKG